MDDDYKIKSLSMMLLNGETKWMYFLIEGQLLKKYNDTWNKVSNSVKKNLIANPSTIKSFWNFQ